MMLTIPCKMTSGIFALMLWLSMGQAFAETGADSPGTGQPAVCVPDGSPEFLRQGNVVVTDAMVDSFLEDRVPPEDRAAVLSSPQRIAQILENLVRVSGFYARACELGLLDADEARREVQRMIMFFGAEAYRNDFIERITLESYETPAREIFLTEPQQFTRPSTIDFWHVLITVDGDADEVPAMRRTIAAFDRLEEAEDFAAIIGELSDDPTFADNNGLYEEIDLEILVSQLAATLDGAPAGVWLPPVRSSFGWHVVRIEQQRPAERLDWEEAREQAEQMARRRHLQQALERRFRELGSEPAEFSEGAVARLRARHGVGRLAEGYEAEVTELLQAEN